MKTALLFLFLLVINESCGDYQEKEYFVYAQERIKTYNPQRKDLVIVIDYRKNILKERLFLLNMKTNEIILSSRVSHAWNSGVLYPNDMSNIPETNKTSGGNFLTLGTKFGAFGYSMIIKGLDQGINNNAQNRHIIFHSDAKMPTIWSNGCFATSEKTNKALIDLTKNGVLVCVIS